MGLYNLEILLDNIYSMIGMYQQVEVLFLRYNVVHLVEITQVKYLSYKIVLIR